MTMISERIETLKLGNIVTIINPEYGRFTGKQGFIVEIINDGNPDGPIGVRFPSWYKWLFDYPHKPDTVVRFEEGDLRKDEAFIAQLHPSDESKRVVGEHMATDSLIPPLLPGITNCMCKDCGKKAFFSIWVNIWGTACNAYVCGDHASCHGCWKEDFPYKVDYKDLGEVTAEPLTKAQILDSLFGKVGIIIPQTMPLIPGDNSCMHEECKKKAWFSIWISLGQVIAEEFHVCGKHAHYHGKRMGGFPMKKEEKEGI